MYKGWVMRVAQSLGELTIAGDVEILISNASANGRTTRQSLEDMPYEVQNNGVDILIIQYGLNDCNYWRTDRGCPRVSLPAFVANLREIIERARLFGAKRVFLNNNHPTTRTTENFEHTDITFEESNRIYNQAIRDMANDLPEWVLFQDVENHFDNIIQSRGSLASYLLADQLHLSVQGHDAYFELMNPLLIKAVLEVV